MWLGKNGSLGWLAYLGCIVTLFSIASDPFAQQLLSFPLERVLLPNINSSITRSQIYDYGGSGEYAAGDWVSAGMINELLALQSFLSTWFID